MNNDQPQPDIPGLDEDLVAYLDGELDDGTSRRLEERLNNDESARQRLRALATSWDLLDHLPRAASDDNFTRTTVELIALEARKDVEAEQAAIPSRNRRRWMFGIGAGLAAVMIGFVAVVLAWPDENERLLRDLPVVQNYELYDVTPQTDGIEFLRRLEREEQFIGDAAVDDAANQPSTEIWDGGSPAREVLAARRAEVESLSPEKKNELRKAYERFRAEPKEEQERFREFDAALRASPDEARLRAVLASYHNWLPTLSPLERANLLKMSPDNAIAEIQRLKREQLRQFARSGGSRQGPLSTKDVDEIERWVQDWAWKKKDEILAGATPEDQEWFLKLPEEIKRRSLIFLTIQPGRPPSPPDLDDTEWKLLLSRLPTVKALFDSQGKQADKLLPQFSLDVIEGIKSAVSKADTPAEKRHLLFGWYYSAQWAKDAFAGGVSQEELRRFFNEDLDEKEREKLLSRAPEDFNKALRFQYHMKKELPPGHLRKFGKRGGWGRGRGDGRGPDGGGRGGFGGGGRGGPRAEFDRDDQERRDREGRHERNSERDRRRGPDGGNDRNDSSERRPPPDTID